MDSFAECCSAPMKSSRIASYSRLKYFKFIALIKSLQQYGFLSSRNQAHLVW